MNILFLTMNNFSTVSEHSIYPDLIRCLTKKGHRVTVLLPREKKYGEPTQSHMEDGVHVIKVRTGNLFDVGMKTKLASRALLCGQYERALNKYVAGVKFDLILYSTPPTIFFPLVNKIKKRDHAYAYLMLKDIFPQNAVDLGMIKNGSLPHRMLRRLEKNLYQVSDTIGCMSPANVSFLYTQDPWISKSKCEVCPNAIEVQPLIGVNKADVRKQLGLPVQKTVFMYGGSLGKPQGIQFFIECLKSLKNMENIFFLVAGEGTYLDTLKELSREYPHLLRVLDWMPVDEYEKVVRASDVGLIFLDQRFTIPNFPSRLLLYMQAGLPVLAATDSNTDIGLIAKENGFGFWCESGDVQEFSKYVRLLTDIGLREEMGKKAYLYLVENYSVEQVCDTILKHVK